MTDIARRGAAEARCSGCAADTELKAPPTHLNASVARESIVVAVA